MNKVFNRVRHETGLLENQSRSFFKALGTTALLGRKFFSDLSKQEDRFFFEDLLTGCGYQENPAGFFDHLFSLILQENPSRICINGIELPRLYLYHLLEVLFPGNRLYAVKDVRQLEKWGRISSRDSRIQAVIDQFPVRLSDHVIRQSMVSENVAKQYLPFPEELDPAGDPITFDGHLKRGVLEQMYENRVIFLLDMRCPVFCRFCFRKHKTTRKETPPKPADVEKAVDHVRSRPAIKEVLITGGEPLLNRPNLEAALGGLARAGHVNRIRIATRCIAYYPHLLLKNNRAYIRYLVEKHRQLKECGKRIEIGIHFVHPDEVSVQSLEIITTLVKNGIRVYVQTPFLNGLNTDGRTLARLFTLLRNAGVKIYYIFVPCSPIHGTKPYWAPVSKAFEAYQYLYDSVSDRCIPKLCTATPLGKIEWHTSGWASETDKDDPRFTWIRTPYTRAYYRQFIDLESDMPVFRENREGTLDARFRLDMGDARLVAGPRPHPKNMPDRRSVRHSLDFSLVRSNLFQEGGFGSAGDSPALDNTCRIHATCLQMKMAAAEKGVEYVSARQEITDLILYLDKTALGNPDAIIQIILKLKQIRHLFCVRLCCAWLGSDPDLFAPQFLDNLSACLDFSIARPFRIEVEAWFLLSGEITSDHARLADLLVENGIEIYANVPLIRNLNDDPDQIVTLANRLRRSGIDFHHLYAGGLRIQDRFNGPEPLDCHKLIDIASALRSSCSGRQIPLHVIRTKQGERPVNLTRWGQAAWEPW